MVRVRADGPQDHHGRSIIEGAVLEVLGLFSDGPSQPRGRSARCLWTVRPGLADGPPGACGQSAWSCAELLSLSPFELRFRFGVVWGCS
jgi:hypothetical protein